MLQATEYMHDNRCRLLIAGECWEGFEEYQAMIRALNLDSQVTFINRYIPNEELAIMLSAADVFVAPYTGGTQSGTLKLAMGFNKPIIATYAIASDKLKEIYPVMKIVQPNNARALASAMSEWNPPPKERVSSTSDKLSWEKIVTLIEKINLEAKI